MKGKEENSFLLLPFLLLSGMEVNEVVCSCIPYFALLEREQASFYPAGARPRGFLSPAVSRAMR